MELNYEVIINYLCPKVEDNIVEKKINIMEKIDNEYFSDIFNNQFYKYGVYKYDSNNNNISLLTSLLYCIDEKYINYNNDDLDNIVNYYKKELGALNIECFIDKFDMNFIIFNLKDGNILAGYQSEFFNPWKPTIFLAYDETFYEPIVCNDYKLFNYTSGKNNVLKNNILFQDITYYDGSKEFTINDNINEVLEYDNLVNNVSDTFITSFDITKNISINKLNKMKKAELVNLLNELNLNIQLLRPTKKDIIQLICIECNINK